MTIEFDHHRDAAVITCTCTSGAQSVIAFQTILADGPTFPRTITFVCDAHVEGCLGAYDDAFELLKAARPTELQVTPAEPLTPLALRAPVTRAPLPRAIVVQRKRGLSFIRLYFLGGAGRS